MYNQIWSPLKQEFVPTLSKHGRKALKMYVNSFMTGGAAQPGGINSLDEFYDEFGKKLQNSQALVGMLNKLDIDPTDLILIKKEPQQIVLLDLLNRLVIGVDDNERKIGKLNDVGEEEDVVDDNLVNIHNRLIYIRRKRLELMTKRSREFFERLIDATTSVREAAAVGEAVQQDVVAATPVVGTPTTEDAATPVVGTPTTEEAATTTAQDEADAKVAQLTAAAAALEEAKAALAAQLTAALDEAKAKVAQLTAALDEAKAAAAGEGGEATQAAQDAQAALDEAKAAAAALEEAKAAANTQQYGAIEGDAYKCLTQEQMKHIGESVKKLSNTITIELDKVVAQVEVTPEEGATGTGTGQEDGAEAEAAAQAAARAARAAAAEEAARAAEEAARAAEEEDKYLGGIM